MAIRLPSQDDISGVGVTRDPGVRASPDDFGAQIARAQQSFGNVMQRLGVMGQEFAQQRQNAEDEVFLNAVDNDLTLTANTELMTAQDNAPAAGEGFTRGVVGSLTGKSTGVIEGLVKNRGFRPSAAAKRRAELMANDKVTSAALSAQKWEHNRRVEWLGVQSDNEREVQRRIYVDPDTTEAQKSEARAKIEASIARDAQTGILSPEQADLRRKQFVEDATFSRGKLAVDRDPSIISKPLPKTVAERSSSAMGYFTSRGWTKEQAAGIVGNLIGESNLNTGARNPGDGRDGSDSIGIGQWNGDRARALKEFASLNRADWRDFNVQLAFVDHELRTSEKTAGDALKGARSIDEATSAFIGYERPAGWSPGNPRGGHNYHGRLKNAAMAAGADPDPAWFRELSPEQQADLRREADVRERQIAAENRGYIETVVNNAPVAVQNTGNYDGEIPTVQDFMDAYGPQDGYDRFQKFDSAMEVGQQSYDFRTMSTGEIQQAVAAAQPTSSGDDAALETQRYQVLAGAADNVIKAREANPVVYTQQAFPSVARAWETAQETGDFGPAMTATAAAQKQLGITNMKLLPDEVSDGAVATFNDPNKTEGERIAAAANLIFSTADPEQRVAVFEQMVKDGLPEMAAGAVRATARGDTGAARRLFEASMVDVSKLPGKLPNTTAEIDEAIQSEIMDVGQIGDIYYGLSDGAADNYLTAQRDSKLMSNAVHMRIRKGEALEDAVQAVAKDLYGDIVPVNASNAQILVPADTDPNAVVRGLTASQPKLREAMERTMTVPDEAKGAASAIINAERAAYIDQVMSEGYWRNSDQGYVFIDPFTGLAVADESGQPLIISDKEAQTVAPPTEQQFPTMGTDYERQLMEDRARRAGQFSEQPTSSTVPDGAPTSSTTPTDERLPLDTGVNTTPKEGRLNADDIQRERALDATLDFEMPKPSGKADRVKDDGKRDRLTGKKDRLPRQ